MPAKKSRLLLTLGDPNGIGPEVILKIFKDKAFASKFVLTVVGSKRILDFYSSLLKIKSVPPDRIIEISTPNKFKVTPGTVNKFAGKIAGDAIILAMELCLEQKFEGMITLPISKESLNLGGYKYHGHTEMLTELSGSDNTAMILYSDVFSVAPITGHIPLADVSKTLTKKLLFNKIVAVNNSLVRNFKIRNPKIALLSLNPHAGDGGVIGNEEEKVINPVIEEMISLGFNIRGAYPSDAFFANKSYKKYDITVAMYHDQGLIPFKMISFDKGVNFTAGLKFIRTSPDHGTAFDIAGSGKAKSESTKQAIILADKLSDNSPFITL